MAYLRSEIVNKDLVEAVLRKIEGTRKVKVLSITIKSPDGLDYPSLLHEQLALEVEASVKGKEKKYQWIAKFHRIEAGPSDFARFQGVMESEVKFYGKLVPELISIGARMPRTFAFLWGDYKNFGKEVLLVENLTNQGFCQPEEFNSKSGLALSQVILAVEWLAKFHGLFHVLIRKSYDGQVAEWLKEHPWVRTAKLNSVEPQTLNEEILQNEGDRAGKWKRSLIKMATETMLEKVEQPGYQDLEFLLRKQDWINKLKDDVYASEDKDGKKSSKFLTLCHGEPWMGNALFQVNEETGESVGAVFSGFHSCTVSRPGFDLAHFLMTSTTRAFRQRYLDLVLQTYLTELQDVLSSQGIDDVSLTVEELRSDYRKGLIVAISFCVFVMPILLGKKPDVKRNFEYLGVLSASSARSHETKAAEEEVKTETEKDEDTKDLEDEVDGDTGLPVPHLPDWARGRLFDGIMDVVRS